MSSGPEGSGERTKDRKPLSTGQRIRNGVIFGALPIIAAVGGKIGYELNQNSQRSTDQGRRDTAARHKQCIEVSRSQSVIRYEEGRAIVRLAGLSEQQKIACGLEGAESQLEPHDSSSRREGISLPDGSEIEQSSVEIKLPDVGELQASAEENLRTAANGTTAVDTVERAGATAAGVFFGGVGWLLGAVGIGYVVGRRQG